MRLTPPRRARRRDGARLVMPWMLSRRTLRVALRAALAEAFATFAASRHDEVCVFGPMLELGRGVRGTGLTAAPPLPRDVHPHIPEVGPNARARACGPAREGGPRRGRVSGAAPEP